MKYYELICLLPTNLTEEELAPRREQILKLLTGQGAEIIRDSELGKFRLTYPIGQAHWGLYWLLICQIDPAKVAALETALKLSGQLLRFSIKKTTAAAKERKYLLSQYQEPLVDREREMPRPIIERRPRFSAPIPRPVPPSAPAGPPLSTEEIEKQIDKILEEKVL